LSPCPTIWKLTPVEAQHFVQDEMAATFGVANYRDRTKEALARPAPTPPPPLEALPGLLGIAEDLEAATEGPPQELNVSIRAAGFGGQGMLMLGEILAEAGLEAGYEVSWLPSYGPEMRSGTSNCHVRISSEPIDSPLVSHPNVLLAMNEPSLRKFLAAVEPGGLVLYNGSEVPEDCARADVRLVALPFTQVADELGASKVGNMVMLGALLEATSLLDQDRVIGALHHVVTNSRWFDLDVAALARGREQVRQADDYLWGV